MEDEGCRTDSEHQRHRWTDTCPDKPQGNIRKRPHKRRSEVHDNAAAVAGYTEIRSAAFATRTIDVNKTTELNVVTSTDANALIIRDKKGNVITPESISYEDKDGERHWKLTMTHKVSGIYIYKVSVEAAYGIMTDTPATVVAYVVPRSVVRPKPSMPKPPLFGWM